MNNDTISLLIQKAADARAHSYAPYSNFSVGAALLCSDGTIYTGANIENSSYTPTVCAERVAFFSAVHDGRRDFSAIAIVGGHSHRPIDALCPPCGVCRQVMSEFCEKDFKIIMENGNDTVALKLEELLPFAFSI